jgi:hypothetical protein
MCVHGLYLKFLREDNTPYKQELNSSETSCDKDERCRSKFVITEMGRENGLNADYTQQS